MTFKKIFSQFNITKQCRQHNLPLWQCPQLLFLVMGLVIILSTLVIYAVGNRYIEDPLLIALIVLVISTILFIIAAVIIRNFERLAEINRMKSEFIRIVTHQLRSPLTNLNWTIDILTSEKLEKINEKKAEYFRILKENSSRMMDLLKDLLIINKIEEGSLIIKKEDVSLEEIIKKVILGFKHLTEAFNIEIKFKNQKDLPNIFIDTHQIRIAIENLIDNAVHYIEGSGTIEIKLEKRDKNLFFEIKDTGIGIPEEDQKHIFQKFFRSKNATRQETQGSGLGLYITKSIIKKSGGKIGFLSQEGVGSTFWFTLPLK